MCGIAGFLSSPGERPNPGILRRMCDELAHRGPDSSGYYCDHRIALGHRRLSIIDTTTTGDQPIGNEDGSVQVIFNGEIYNYLELKRDLEQRGHRFASATDTEVLVHLYEECGEAMAEHLNGMYAFAIWDRRTETLFLSRDRTGEKPLYYCDSIPGVELAFASELKALVVMPGFPAELDSESLTDFLALSYVPQPKTIYRAARQLSPAEWMSISGGRTRRAKYWTIDPTARSERSEANLTEDLQALCVDAVRCRLLSDVPLGAFLSGGVDSSAVVAAMTTGSADPPRTFSIGFTDSNFDETRHAQAVAEKFRTIHRQRTVTPDITEVLPILARSFDEPFGDSSAIPMLYLARMTRENVTVALSGDGADEVFGGYRRYRFGMIEERLRERFPRWFRHSVVAWSGRVYPKLDWAPQMFRGKTLLNNVSMDLGDAYFTSMSTFRDAGLRRILNPTLGNLAGYDPRESFRARFLKYSEADPLTQMQAVDLETYLPSDILVKTDRATMAYSLEGRAPWLDHRLIEFGLKLPPSLKVKGQQGKWLFKRSLEPALPESILYRPKMGFSVPLAAWFRSSLKEVFFNTVLKGPAVEFLDRTEVLRLWSEHQGERWNHDRKLFNLLMFGMWAEVNLNKNSSLAQCAGVLP